MSPPDFEGFAREIMKAWPDGGIDGLDLHDIAEKHRIIVSVPGGFDPRKHRDDYSYAEPGDDWFVLNYEARPE